MGEEAQTGGGAALMSKRDRGGASFRPENGVLVAAMNARRTVAPAGFWTRTVCTAPPRSW